MRPAAFLDRDGTLIEDVPYLSDPGGVRLLPGVPEALRLLKDRGFACIVVTNQSAVGRGLISEQRLAEIHSELRRQLGAEGILLDGLYYCPAEPRTEDRTRIEHPDRKPAPGMLLKAARELNLELSGSWMIGDMLSDTLAGRNAGCRGSIYVKTGRTAPPKESHPSIDFIAEDLLAAARHILNREPQRKECS